MNKDSQEKLMLAVLSKKSAKRDELIFKIQSIFDAGFNDDVNSVKLLSKYFDKLSSVELSLGTVQEFYARHFNSIKKEDDGSIT